MSIGRSIFFINTKQAEYLYLICLLVLGLLSFWRDFVPMHDCLPAMSVSELMHLGLKINGILKIHKKQVEAQVTKQTKIYGNAKNVLIKILFNS